MLTYWGKPDRHDDFVPTRFRHDQWPLAFPYPSSRLPLGNWRLQKLLVRELLRRLVFVLVQGCTLNCLFRRRFLQHEWKVLDLKPVLSVKLQHLIELGLDAKHIVVEPNTTIC